MLESMIYCTKGGRKNGIDNEGRSIASEHE